MHIYISNERENKLRAYASRLGRPVSAIVGEWIDQADNTPFTNETVIKSKETIEKMDEQIINNNLTPNCERPFCKSKSDGKYRVVTNDGQDEWTGNLCVFHWNQARKEGEVHEA